MPQAIRRSSRFRPRSAKAPRKIARATIPGAGQTTIAMPAAIDSSPVATLIRRTRLSIPEVSAVVTPSMMNKAPVKVARLTTLQLMLKMSTPATISSSPLTSSRHQFEATRSAASRLNFCVIGQCAGGEEHVWLLRLGCVPDGDDGPTGAAPSHPGDALVRLHQGLANPGLALCDTRPMATGNDHEILDGLWRFEALHPEWTESSMFWCPMVRWSSATG